MLLEASIALLLIMGLTWIAAIWASYDEGSGDDSQNERSKQPTQHSEKPSKKVA